MLNLRPWVRNLWDCCVVNDGRPVQVALTQEERAFLRAALLDWGGPARPTEDIARAMGFGGAESMSEEAWTLWKRLESGEGLSLADWRRTLLAVELIFASDVVGSGLDWPITSGYSDVQSITILRGLQRKLPRWRSSTQFELDAETGQAPVDDRGRPPGR